MPRMHRLPPGEYWFEDLAPGDCFDTASVVVTAASIDEFARLSGDSFAVHMDDGFARSLGFPARLAHGLLCLSLTDGLKNRAQVQLQAVASLGWNWRFRAPVIANDRIVASIAVKRVFLSKKGQGVVVLSIVVKTQDDTVVQSGTTTLILRKKPAA